MQLHTEQLQLVQRQVARGEYQVNPVRVAEAMLARIGASVLDRELVTVREDDRGRPPALNVLRQV
jgi:hypothetical protein